MKLLKGVIAFVTVFLISSNSVFAVTDGFVYPVGNENIKPTTSYSSGNGYIITQQFEFDYDDKHTGVDLANGSSAGTVSATAAGKVVDRQDNVDGWGNMIRIEHVLPSGKIVYSQYGHMLNGSLLVNKNDSVGKGQSIGKVGSTGSSTGPHLHFEIKKVNSDGCGYITTCGSWSDYYDPLHFVEDNFNNPPSGKPDLVVREVNLSKMNLIPGESFHIDTRIKNQGDADINDSFKIKFLLSNDTGIASSPTTLADDSISSLGKGDSTWKSADVTAPQTPGTYNITVKADSSKNIDESNEGNNYFDPPVVITVNISPAVIAIITNLIMAEDEKPAISVTPESLDFGAVNVGVLSSPQTVTVKNVGNAALTIGTLSTSSTEFVLKNDLCSGKTLAVATSCTVNILFKPASAGQKDEALNVPSNDTKTPVAKAELLGNAVMPTPPLAPSNLTAIAISAAQIVLAWKDNSNNEAGFKIERKAGVCASTNFWSQIVVKAANSITFTNTVLTAGAPYSFRIKAYNAGGASTYSKRSCQ